MGSCTEQLFLTKLFVATAARFLKDLQKYTQHSCLQFWEVVNAETPHHCVKSRGKKLFNTSHFKTNHRLQQFTQSMRQKNCPHFSKTIRVHSRSYLIR